MVLLVMVRVPVLDMPRPLLELFPFAIVRPDRVALTVFGTTLKIRNDGADRPRVTLSRFAPGPLIVTDWFSTSSPLVSSITPVTAGANVIVVPAHTLAIMARSEPGPLSSRGVAMRFPGLPPGRCLGRPP